MALFWVGLDAVDVAVLYRTDELIAVVGFADHIPLVAYSVVGVDEVEVELVWQS